jgi:glycosyltransferase involved in cell wall biosynthesis
MKIVHVSSYFPPHLGGQENVAREISERLAEKGEDIKFFTSDIGCPQEQRLNSTEHMKICYLPAKEYYHTPIIKSLYSELMKIPKDSIIHVHVAQAYVPEIVYKVWKKRKIPYIAQIHCDIEPTSFLGKIILSPYKNIFLKKFFKHAENVTVSTEFYKERISKKYSLDKNKIIVIPNGVGEEFFTECAVKNKVPHLLYVGRISPEKNPLKLIESAALSKSKFILDVVGDGDLFEEIKRLANKKNLKNVIFHGKQTGKELIKLYQNADAFISTSEGEIFSLTILEAMASGLPIIASDVRGNDTLVKGVGILVNPPAPENFAREIDFLLSDKELCKKLSEQSLKFAKEYNWDSVINKFEDVYKKINNETLKTQQSDKTE